ncbi:MAG: transporter [Vicinamibacterales bacterium]
MLRAVCAMVLVFSAEAAYAQQRPLVTEDPEPVGAGRVLLESGVDLLHGQHYPVSGLEGDLVRVPTVGVSVGLSSIAELQIDGGLHEQLSITKRNPAPLSSLLNVTGESTSDVSDIVIGTKVRLLSEQGGRPAVGIRFATKLPNASNESGLGLDTTDFFASLLAAKNVQSVRVVGNVGFAILGDPTSGNRQNDVLTYGVSIARALTEKAEVVGEVNGRANTRSAGPLPGTETRSAMRLGGRYTTGSVRLDAGAIVGLTNAGPTIGMTAGLTWVFNAFKVP